MGKIYITPTGSRQEGRLANDLINTKLPSKEALNYRGKDAVSRICREMDITLDNIRCGKRKTSIVAYRWILWAVLRERGLTWPMIAIISEKDHTAIMHGVKKYYALCEKYKIKSVRDINAE